MNSIPLVVNNPGTFTYTEGQTYYNELLAHAILEHGYAMSQEGYEITWEDADIFSYTALWTKQTASLFGLVDALNGQGADTLLQNYFETLARELNELTTLEYRRENYELRAKMIAVGEKALALNSAGTLELPQPLEIAIPEAVQVQRVYPAFPESLWNQQTLALQEQTAFLNKVKENLNAKLEQLPQEGTSQSVIAEFISSLLEELSIDYFFAGLKYVLRWLSGAGGGATAVMSFLLTIGFLALKDLWDRYTQGVQACDALIAENAEALAISLEDPEDTAPLWEYYRLRETVIVRHQRDIHNLLTEIIALEQRTAESLGEPTSDMTELISAVKDLGMEGYEIEAEDFKIRKLGRTLTTESW